MIENKLPYYLWCIKPSFREINYCLSNEFALGCAIQNNKNSQPIWFTQVATKPVKLDVQTHSFYLDQVWSTLPALELLPLDCSRRMNSPGAATPMQAKWIKLDLAFIWITLSCTNSTWCLIECRLSDNHSIDKQRMLIDWNNDNIGIFWYNSNNK